MPSHGANTCKDGSDKDQNNPAVPALISGSVVDAESGKHISGAKVKNVISLAMVRIKIKVDFWLTASSGKYAVQDESVDPGNLCGFLFTDKEGSFSFRAIKPTPYKVFECS